MDERITKTDLIPENSEKMKMVRINDYVFLDTMAFLPASLEKLSEELFSKNTEFDHTIFEQLGIFDDMKCDKKDEKEMKKLLFQKNFFPYEYLTSYEKLSEKKLPPRKEFKSLLTNSNINEEEYAHAKKVFSVYNCKNLKDYTELYCKTDTALIAELFLEYRKRIKKVFKLDPCHYISGASLSWDSMLFYTGIELELLTDIDKVLLKAFKLALACKKILTFLSFYSTFSSMPAFAEVKVSLTSVFSTTLRNGTLLS